MDRTALAICAGILCPLGAILNVGCDARPTPSREAVRVAQTPVLLQPPLDDLVDLSELDDSLVVPASGFSDGIDSFDGDESSLSIVGPRAEANAKAAEGNKEAGDAHMVPAGDETTELKFAATQPESNWVAPKIQDPGPILADEGEALVSERLIARPLVDAEPAQGDTALAPPESMPLRSSLPWAQAGPRSAEMAAVASQAEARVQHGIQLAGRGAHYSARAEFIAALQLIAQANDAEQKTRIYSTGLTAGVIALRESADFVRQHSSLPDFNLERIVARHKTPILKQADSSKVTALAAAQAYYTFAREQLTAAAGQEHAGSMALYGLGKIAMANANKSQQLEFTAQAMSFYQAALMSDANNYRAANELGVLLAQNGRLLQARDLLIRSVTLSSQPAAWQNLAAVHTRLGEENLAQRARHQVERLEQGKNPQLPAVEWVDAATFANSAPAGDGLTPPGGGSAKSAATASPSNTPAATTAKKGMSDWLPKNPWR
jgi:tetratricopeptide (TPR) repeat protein